MKKKTVRAGIVGSGFAARFHLDAMRRVTCTDVEIVGVYSPHNARRFARARGIRALDTLAALIDACDVVHVLVPPARHEEIAVECLRQDKSAIVEKPLTGFFGGGDESFDARGASMERAREEALASVRRLAEAEASSEGRILYAENWIYAPAIRKECEIIEKTRAQIIWMHGEQSHSGSGSPTYGFWRHNGGGALIGKGCHPLAAALYLKRFEGRARDGNPIRPIAVSCRTHSLTRLRDFQDAGQLRTDYFDVEDFAVVHVIFEDGTAADICASEIVQGGVHNWLEVNANNHRSICNINPNTAMLTYNPRESLFDDIYTVEKTGTKQGWNFTAVDENHFTGYSQEVEAFYQAVTGEGPLESDMALAADTISTIYSGYLSAERKGAEVEVEHV